jgi:plastocyanin
MTLIFKSSNTGAVPEDVEPMDPKKNRRWVVAGLAAAAVVFLIMATGEVTTAAPGASATTSAQAVLASDAGASIDPGPSSDSNSPSSSADATDSGVGADATGDATAADSNSDNAANSNADGVERNAVLDFLRQLLDALGITPQELADSVDNANSASGAGTGAARDNSEPVAGSAESAATGSITIANFEFGQPVTVAPGATVEVQNTDSAPHNVTADGGAFATENIRQDETATFTAPTRPGRYAYSCTLHPEMTGTLIVEEAASGAGAGAALDEGAAGTGTSRSSGSATQDTPGATATRSPAATNSDTGAAEPTQAPSTRSGYGTGNGY